MRWCVAPFDPASHAGAGVVGISASMPQLDSIKQRVLEIVYERGPLNDGAIAPEIVDQWAASDVAPHTAELAADGLIEESEFAPGRWQITDAGRRTLGHDPGR